LSEVEGIKNRKNDKSSVKIDTKLDKARLLRKQSTEGRRKALALRQELLEKNRRRHEQLLAEHEMAIEEVAEKLQQAKLHGEQAEAEALQKKLERHAEELAQAARAHAEQLQTEALQNAKREHEKAVDARLKGQQIPAEALRALHQHFEELGKARRDGEQRQAEALKTLHQHIAELENGRREGERHQVEALKELQQHVVELARSRERQELDKAQREDRVRKSALVDGASLQRANDERIEKLSAMVTELAGQVERLQKELTALRGETEAKTRGIK
jgi:hypothetical protein